MTSPISFRVLLGGIAAAAAHCAREPHQQSLEQSSKTLLCSTGGVLGRFVLADKVYVKRGVLRISKQGENRSQSREKQVPQTARKRRNQVRDENNFR
jgi:hypothetical protein